MLCWAVTDLLSLSRTPANLFHVLRPLLHRDFHKLLIHLFSKSLLRHPQAHSYLVGFMGDASFQRYPPEPHPESMFNPDEIMGHALCTGQAYNIF
jgi:2-oxoglutarate dehydrogenase E1 component